MIVNPDGSVSVSAMPNVYLGSIPFLHGGWLQQMQQQAAQLAQTQAAQAQAAQAQARTPAAQAQVDPYSAIEPYLGFNLNPDDFYSGMPLSPQTAPATTKPAPELMPSHQPVVPVAPAQPDVDLSIGYGLVPSPVMTQEPGTDWSSLLGTTLGGGLLGGGLLTKLIATYLRNRNAATGVGVDGKPFVNIPDTPPRPWFNMATYRDTPGVSAARMAELRGNPAAIEYANSINKPRYPLLGPHVPPPGYTGVWTEDMIKAAFPEYNQPFNVTDPLAPKTDMQNYLLRRGPSYDDPRAVEQMFKNAQYVRLDPANALPINIEEKLTSAQRRGSPPKSAVDRSVEAGMNASTPLKGITAANISKRATAAAKPLIITPTKTSAQPSVPTSVEPGLASSARVGGLSSRVARAMGKGMNFTLPASIAVLAASLADPGRVEAAQQSVPQLPVPESTNLFTTPADLITQSTIQGINDVPVFLQLLSQMMANMPEDGDLMW